MQVRHCPRCAQDKSLNEFSRNKHKVSGYSSWCKVCTKVAVRKWFDQENNKSKHKQQTIIRRRERKTKLVDMFGGKCADCEQSFPNCCYDFHHLDPSQKDASVANLGTMKWERILDEIVGKCVMLCSNCHRIRHHGWD